jgi:hypothetical protein
MEEGYEVLSAVIMKGYNAAYPVKIPAVHLVSHYFLIWLFFSSGDEDYMLV